MLYKQLKRYNNFSVLKGDAEILVEFLTTHALYKLKEKQLAECKDSVRSLFLKYGCKVFNLPHENEDGGSQKRKSREISVEDLTKDIFMKQVI